jgi:hypothetical protein
MFYIALYSLIFCANGLGGLRATLGYPFYCSLTAKELFRNSLNPSISSSYHLCALANFFIQPNDHVPDVSRTARKIRAWMFSTRKEGDRVCGTRESRATRFWARITPHRQTVCRDDL